MIFTLFAFLVGLWAWLSYKEQKQINWAYIFLAVLLLGVEIHFFLLEREISDFFWASGTAGSGLTYGQCQNFTGGSCTGGYTYHTYLAYNDQAVGEYIAYRKMEAMVLGTMGGPLYGLVLIALLYILKDLLTKMRLLVRR